MTSITLKALSKSSMITSGTNVGMFVGVAIGVAVLVERGVLVGGGVGDGVAVGSGVGVGVVVGNSVAVGTGEGVSVGRAGTVMDGVRLLPVGVTTPIVDWGQRLRMSMPAMQPSLRRSTPDPISSKAKMPARYISIGGRATGTGP